MSNNKEKVTGDAGRMDHDNSDRSNVPDWKLERYLLGELPEGELEAVRELERSDEALRARIGALRASDAEILAAYEPARMGRRIEAAMAASASADAVADVGVPVSENHHSQTKNAWKGRIAKSARGPSRGWRRLSPYAVPALACAALFLALPVSMRQFSPVDVGVDEDDAAVAVAGVSANVSANVPADDRSKGGFGAGPLIEVWRKEGEAARKLAPSAAAREGDVVQLQYAVPEFCYGALVSVDGRGVMTVHLSGGSGKAAPLAPGKPVALGASYQLDDAPLFEVFYLITSPENFDVESVTRPLRNANHPIGGWDGPDHTNITAFALRKLQEEAMN